MMLRHPIFEHTPIDYTGVCRFLDKLAMDAELPEQVRQEAFEVLLDLHVDALHNNLNVPDRGSQAVLSAINELHRLANDEGYMESQRAAARKAIWGEEMGKKHKEFVKGKTPAGKDPKKPGPLKRKR